MQTVTLPSGKRANLRAVEDVTERQRRPLVKLRGDLAGHPEFVAALEKAQADKKLTKAEEAAVYESLGDVTDIIERMGDLLVVAAVESWDYGFAVTEDNLLDISAKDLDKLREIAAPYMTQLMPDFSASRDESSPTGV